MVILRIWWRVFREDTVLPGPPLVEGFQGGLCPPWPSSGGGFSGRTVSSLAFLLVSFREDCVLPGLPLGEFQGGLCPPWPSSGGGFSERTVSSLALL
jgi:hypothetical protein